MAVTPNHIEEMYSLMVREFSYIGIKLTSMNINNPTQPPSLIGQHSPMAYSHGYPIMDLHFTCSPEQMEYLEIFVSESTLRVEPVAPPAYIHNPMYTDESQPTRYKISRVFDCVMQVTVTGGSVDPLIHSFRHETEKLRHAIESMEFDQEVEKMLTEDEYNS